MLDTPNTTEAQEPADGDAQAKMAMGPAIEALWTLKGNEARQAQVFWIAAGMVLEMPGLTMGEKLLLIALYRRVDFARGVVDDSHTWLARWLRISKRAVQNYRKALAAKGLTIERQRQDERGDDATSEIALPMLAKMVSDGVWQTLPRGMAKSATKEGRASSDREELPYHTLPDGSAECVDDASHPLVVLRDWRKARFFIERGEAFTAEPNHTVVDLVEWREMLNRYGGAPTHVTTGAALRQAIEIAHEVHAANLTGETLPIRHIVAAIACAIARAHGTRKKLHSMGFIAERLVRSVSEECDATPIYDLPVIIDSAAYAQAHEVATTLLTNDSRGALARKPLMATVQVEELARIIAEHGGVHAIHTGWAYACWQDKWPEKGTVYVGWRWLVPAIEAAKTSPKRPAWWRKA